LREALVGEPPQARPGAGAGARSHGRTIARSHGRTEAGSEAVARMCSPADRRGDGREIDGSERVERRQREDGGRDKQTGGRGEAGRRAERQRDGETRDRETEGWRDGEMERWRDGEMERRRGRRGDGVTG
jgi:hypothetical protein